MLLKDSRYANTPALTGEAGASPPDGLRPRAIGAAEGVLEHTVQSGDRLDRLAYHYYGNDRLWWRIVDANPAFVFAGCLLDEDMEGEVILIPKARE